MALVTNFRFELSESSTQRVSKFGLSQGRRIGGADHEASSRMALIEIEFHCVERGVTGYSLADLGSLN